MLVEHGRVVVSFGGLAGDCDNYVGLRDLDVRQRAAAARSTTPSRPRARPGCGRRPDPVLGRNGHVYVASGNGAELHGRLDKSDSVTELSAIKLHRLSMFAPSTWKDDNIRDLDLGSSSPISVPGVHRIVIAGKRGVVYLLREHFGGVGSAVAKLERLPRVRGAALASAGPC